MSVLLAKSTENINSNAKMLGFLLKCFVTQKSITVIVTKNGNKYCLTGWILVPVGNWATCMYILFTYIIREKSVKFPSIFIEKLNAVDEAQLQIKINVPGIIARS